MTQNNFGVLYIIGTPIGNLDDTTLRAIETLKNVDIIACEDTRITFKLLQKYDISKPLTSYYQENSLIKTPYIIEKLNSGNNIALVSDSGTPAISDPGSILVSEAIKNNITVVPIPGVSAVTTLFSITGWPSTGFVFLGFLSKKSGKLKKEIRSVLDLCLPTIFFVSPYRIVKTLKIIADNFEDLEIVVGRELTKKFEEIVRGDTKFVLNHFMSKIPKGEFVVAIRKVETKGGR